MILLFNRLTRIVHLKVITYTNLQLKAAELLKYVGTFNGHQKLIKTLFIEFYLET